MLWVQARFNPMLSILVTVLRLKAEIAIAIRVGVGNFRSALLECRAFCKSSDWCGIIPKLCAKGFTREN